MPIDPETIDKLDHRRLQVLAKEYGVTANQKRPKIVKELLEVSSKTGHWEACSQLRLRLARVQGFEDYLQPLPEHRIQRAAEAQQLWDTLKLGASLCFLFNQLPDVPDVKVDSDEAEADDERDGKAAAADFLDALQGMRESGRWSGGSFDLSDLYHDEGSKLDPATVLKVVSILIDFVDLIPYPKVNFHIHDLPVELLSTIFKIATRTDLEDYSVMPRNIILVCRHWHKVGSRTADLWTKINVDGRLRSRNRKVTKEAKKIVSFVDLSMDADLTVVFHQDQQDILESQLDLTDYLARGTQRVRTFAIISKGAYSNSRNYVDRQIRSISTMSRLHTLILKRIPMLGRLHEKILSNSLRHIEVYNAPVDWQAFQFPNLEILTHQEKWSWRISQITQFSIALSTMQHLQHLSIRFSEDNHPYFSALPNLPFIVPHITLPALTKLELGGPKYFLAGVLHFLSAPRLHDLRLIGLTGAEPIPAMSWTECTPSFPVLRSLALWLVPSPSILLAKIVQAREPQLDIVVSQGEYADFFTGLTGTICEGAGGNWECRHADCQQLSEEHKIEESVVRIRTRGSTGL